MNPVTHSSTRDQGHTIEASRLNTKQEGRSDVCGPSIDYCVLSALNIIFLDVILYMVECSASTIYSTSNRSQQSEVRDEV